MKQGLLEKIKSRGYWRINFEPLVDAQKLQTLEACRELVGRCCVQFRGWDYPHYPKRTGDDAGIENHGQFCEGWIDWWSHSEFWRMYQSGQYLHYLALWDDWRELDRWSEVLGGPIQEHTIPHDAVNVIGGIVYQLTEVFQFLSKLVAAGVYDEGVRVTVALHNMRGRMLCLNDPMRAPLFHEYRAAIDAIEFSEVFGREELLAEPEQCSLRAILFILERFNWGNPPIATIQQDQDKLVRRLV